MKIFRLFIYILTILLLLFSPLFSEDYSIIYNNASGNNQTIENYEELLVDDEFSFVNNNFKFEHKLNNKIKYYINSFFMTKNYKLETLKNNKTQLFKTKLTYDKQDLYLNYKQKRFENNNKYDYNQSKIYTKLENSNPDIYTFRLNLGANYFDYINRDDFDTFYLILQTNFKKHFNKFMFMANYRTEISDRILKERIKYKEEMFAELTYAPDYNYLSRLKFKIYYGQRDTKDDNDDYDTDIDYEYRQYIIKSFHKISKRFRTDVKYQYYKKDYMQLLSDYRNQKLINHILYDFINSKNNRLWTNTYIEYKKTEYTLKTINNYNKFKIEAILNFKARKNYKVSLSFEDNIYKYNDITKDKIRLIFNFDIEKYLFDKTLTIYMNTKYKYTDNLYKNDVKNSSFKVGVKYLF